MNERQKLEAREAALIEALEARKSNSQRQAEAVIRGDRRSENSLSGEGEGTRRRWHSEESPEPAPRVSAGTARQAARILRRGRRRDEGD